LLCVGFAQNKTLLVFNSYSVSAQLDLAVAFFSRHIKNFLSFQAINVLFQDARIASLMKTEHTSHKSVTLRRQAPEDRDTTRRKQTRKDGLPQTSFSFVMSIIR
ncbi:MAG: hypothetical protein ABI758_07130, partial [Candidatus Woesebacteria bacterium]